MKIFELNGKEIRVPEGMDEITVKELIQIHSLGELTGQLKDISKILEVFNGPVNITRFPLDTLIEVSSILSNTLFGETPPDKIDSFVFEGRTYKVMAPEELLVREFIDFQELSGEPVKNLPLLLSIICLYEGEDVPEDEKGYIEYIGIKRDLFMNLDARTAQGCLLFFSNAFTTYAASTLEYLETVPELRQKIEEITKEMKG